MKQIVYKRWKSRKSGVDRLDQFKNLAGEKAARVVLHWGLSFAGRKDLPWFAETYRRLLEKGVRFPPADDDTRAPIDTPAKTPDALRNSNAAKPRKEGVPGEVNTAVKDTTSSIQLLQEMTESGATPDLLHDIVEELRKNLKSLRQLVDPNLDSEKILSLILATVDKAEEALKKSGYADSIKTESATKSEADEETSDEIDDSDLLRRMEGTPKQSHSRASVSLSPSVSSPSVTPVRSASVSSVDVARSRASSSNPFDFFSDVVSPASSAASLKPSASNPTLSPSISSPPISSQSSPVLTPLSSPSGWENFSSPSGAPAPIPQRSSSFSSPQPVSPHMMASSPPMMQQPIFGSPGPQVLPSPFAQQPQQQFYPQPQQPIYNGGTMYGSPPAQPFNPFQQQPPHQPYGSQPYVLQQTVQTHVVQQQVAPAVSSNPFWS